MLRNAKEFGLDIIAAFVVLSCFSIANPAAWFWALFWFVMGALIF